MQPSIFIGIIAVLLLLFPIFGWGFIIFRLGKEVFLTEVFAVKILYVIFSIISYPIPIIFFWTLLLFIYMGVTGERASTIGW